MTEALIAGDSENLHRLLARSGIGLPAEIVNNLARGRIILNGQVAAAGSRACAGDTILIGRLEYRIVASRNSGHLRVLPERENDAPIAGRHLVQCGYHKCLTMYYRKVMSKTTRSPLTSAGNFTHFFHRLDEFYRRCADFPVASISGHAIDLDRFDEVRVTRFMRDPRDLLVSGYYYHLRSAESWCDLVEPEDSDWQVVNGKVPAALPAGLSFAQYLKQATLQQGLLAELDFRQYHFDSMLQWPQQDPRVMLVRYEDLVNNEAETYDRMFEFYGFNRMARFVGRHYARRYRAARRQARSRHIRNSSAGQWRQLFSSELTQEFYRRYRDLLERYNYPTS